MALVKYTGKNVLGILLKDGGIFRFMPGVNEVAEATLAEMKAHPLFKRRIEKELIQILHEKTDADGKTAVNEMLANIPNIFDVRLLKKIIDSDGRKAVVNAAKTQLDLIKNPKKEDDVKDEHFS